MIQGVDKPRLVINNHAPEEPRKLRRAPKVSPYCPTCKGSTWMLVHQGPADTGGKLTNRVRCCVHCLAKGKVTTW